MRALLFFLLLLGCDETEVVDRVAARAEPLEAPAVDEPPLLSTPGVLADATWTYFESVPAGSVCGIGDGGYEARCDPHLIGDPRTYDAVDVNGAPHLVRRDGEATVFDTAIDAMRGASALVTELDLPSFAVWVAGLRDGDVFLARLDGDDGHLVGSVLVPQLPGQPATGVRITRRGEDVVLHVRASEPWLASVRPLICASSIAAPQACAWTTSRSSAPG